MSSPIERKKKVAEEAGRLFAEFVSIVQKLRDPNGGCPWDLEQTHDSIRPYLIEECYEALEAIEAKDDKEFLIELGDVLLQVVLHSQIAADRGAFQVGEVVEAITQKMIKRHPHVFGEVKVDGSKEVLKNWGEIKKSENKEGTTLSGVPKNLPALIRAQRLGEKASQVGFDWSSKEGVEDKLREEIAEFEAELRSATDLEPNKARIEEELGDVLFTCAQLARFVNIRPEDALHRACERFMQRFGKVEERIGGDFRSHNEQQLENLWREAKS
jgi:tetrapyrrole methylase family protein/MazG family protein